MKKTEKFPYISMVNFKISLAQNQCLPFGTSRPQMFFKVGVLKSYAIYAGKHLCWSIFLKKFQYFMPTTLKETPAKVFSCEYCKIFKNSFFHRTLPVAASALYHYFLKLLLKRPLNYSKQRPCS